MENDRGVKDYIRRQASKDIIMKHILIETLEEKYSDEYIETMYRISPFKIRNLYAALKPDERTEIEEELKKQIATGDIDIKQSAKDWHREALRAEYIRRINTENRKGKEH